MHIWLQAIHLIIGSKDGISSSQLYRTLGVRPKTAWFIGRRICEAMRTGEGSVGKGRETSPECTGHQAADHRWKEWCSPNAYGQSR